MLKWWFGCECDTDMYNLWHPGAHKYSAWGDFEDYYKKGDAMGSTHFIRETLGNDPTEQEMQLKYLDPATFYGKEAVDGAKARGDADVLLYGIGGPLAGPKNEKGEPVFMTYLGVGRDTFDGLVLRNHYWIGDTLPLPPEEMEKMVPDEFALNLMLHDSNEFHILGKVIPPFYRRGNWDTMKTPEPY